MKEELLRWLENNLEYAIRLSIDLSVMMWIAWRLVTSLPDDWKPIPIPDTLAAFWVLRAMVAGFTDTVRHFCDMRRLELEALRYERSFPPGGNP